MQPYDWNIDEGAWSPRDELWTAEEIYLVAERAWLLYRQGAWEESTVLCRGLTAIEPQNAYAWKVLALSLAAGGHHAEAWECWDRLASLNRADTDALAGRCETAIALKRFDHALQDVARLEASGSFRAAGQAVGLRIRLEAATFESGPR